MVLPLRLAPMLPTDEELNERQRRQSWWLLVARVTSGHTQADAASRLGIVASSYGDFERGVTAPSLRQLAILSALYDVPLMLLTDPPPTDEERIERETGRRSSRTLLLADVPVRRAS